MPNKTVLDNSLCFYPPRRWRIQRNSSLVHPVQSNAVSRGEFTLHSPQPQDVFRDDAFDTADLAIVFGASKPELTYRIESGVNLVTTKRVPKLLLTGYGRPSSRVKRRSEASQMKAYALANGVSENQILIEDESTNTVENACKCLGMLATHPALKDVLSIALVSSAWHMLRSLTIMLHHSPQTLTFFCHPAGGGCTAANWRNDREGIRLVENELRLISTLLTLGYKLPCSPTAE